MIQGKSGECHAQGTRQIMLIHAGKNVMEFIKTTSVTIYEYYKCQTFHDYHDFIEALKFMFLTWFIST